MSLQPPSEPAQHLKDPGAHELAAAESSDDHFSDASEGTQPFGRNRALSIPVTRVEKVDDEPRHGEVPGTEAYKIRSQDAVPDEIEIVPDGTRSRSTSRVSEADRPLTPGGTPIPRTVVEKVDPDAPSHGDVPGTEAYDMRTADAKPDEVVQAPASHAAPLEPSPTPNDRSRSPSPPLDQQEPSVLITSEIQLSQESQKTSQSDLPQPPKTENTIASPAEENADDFDDFAPQPTENNHQNDDDADDGFGDDFDEFEEGGANQGEGGEDDDFGDFDDFDDGFQQPEETPVAAPPPQPVSQPLAHLPNLNFTDLQTSKDILDAMSPYMAELFPELYTQETASSDPSAALPTDPILTDRSASLWSQLVAPPPLQPPNWIRSRIRRLFLVSLGVPVDLDEILPASKQKKLVLPNIHLPTQQQQEKDEKSRSTSTGRKGPAPPPEFDINEASMLAKTTDTATEAYSDDELKMHVQRLEELIKDASAVLEYWIQRKESAVGDKEAFEGVIENLVGFVKSRR